MFVLLLFAGVKKAEEKHAVREAAILRREQDLDARSEQLAAQEGKLQVCAQSASVTAVHTEFARHLQCAIISVLPLPL